MILIALGSNLPFLGLTPRAICEAALAALVADGRLGHATLSSWYATAPIPPSQEQPDYVNAVARFTRTTDRPPCDPAAMLALLHTIEARFGRVRNQANASRTLDLDLVAFGDLVRDQPDPILPHPRCHLRRFVLEPLADVAPDWVHPVLGIGVADLLGALPAGGITRLD